MPQRSIRFSDRVLKEVDTVWRTRGFASPTAFIRYAVKQELSERQEGLTGAEERIAATLIQVRKDVFRVARAQQALFAYVDTLAKALLTCVPDPPAEARPRAVACAKERHEMLIKSSGVPWSANPSSLWKTSSPTLITHNAGLHILRYNVLSTVHPMADDPQAKKIPLIFFRTVTGSEPVREWLKELSEEERPAIGKDLLRAQWRWPVGMPLWRAMGSGFWEIRTDLPTKRTARVLLCVYREHLVAFAWVRQEDPQNARWGFGAGAEAQEGAGAMSKKHMGSSVDDFLKEEGIFEEAQAQAVKEVVAWQLAEAMKKKKISKNKMATLLKTSRTQVDRLLSAKDDITLSSLQRAAAMVGRRVTIELV
jgi:antitoxin HicB